MSAASAKARTLTGRVVSDKADKTVRVRIQRIAKHPLYGKVIRRHSHILAHDESNEHRVGDEVVIRESTRFSKRKAWVVVGKAAAQR